jgi:hypothetical protein
MRDIGVVRLAVHTPRNQTMKETANRQQFIIGINSAATESWMI